MEVLVGQTDFTCLVKIRDTAGAAKTALTEASIDIAYARVETDNDVTTTDVTPAALTALTDAHTDWGFEEVSATDHPGLYRLDIADAVFASGAWSAVVTITGTGLDPADLEFVLVDHNPQTAIAAVLADTNELQTDWVNGGRLDLLLDATLADTAELQTDWTNGGRLDLLLDATLADTGELQTDWADGGRLDLILDARASQTSVNTVDDFLDTEIAALTTAVADLPTNAELATALGTADDAVLAAIAALNNLSAAQVATEIADALGTDTYAEPTGVPAATSTLASKLGFIYMALRNRIDVTATKKTFYDDGGAAEWEKDLSDDATTYSESEANAI